jgi:uncharacterized membrane protein HdeD (DUF308 family)
MNSENTHETWWLVLIRGLALLFLGLFAIFWPGLTFAAFTIGFALYLVIDGVVNIIEALFTHKENKMWILQLLIGILEIAVGVYALEHPGITAAVLAILVGAVFLVRGVIQIIMGFDKHMDHRALSIVVGILGVVVGIAIMMHPVRGGIAYTWVLGVFALIAGPVNIAQAFQVRKVEEEAAGKKK